MSETGSRFSKFSRQSTFLSEPELQQEEEVVVEPRVAPLDYYGVLNVDKTSDESEIKNAYKRLCMIFHPDKHADESKAFAEQKFHLIQKAYSVLSDSNKRHIYDLYGESGLDESWDLTKSMDQNRLREEFEHRAKLKQLIEEQTKVKSKGEINIALDATRLFGGKRGRRRPARVGLASIFDWNNVPEFQHAMVVHQWESRVDEANTLILKGMVLTKNGLGSGGMSMSLRHVHDATLWGEVTGTVGDEASAAVKVVKNFTPEVYAIGSLGLSAGNKPLMTSILFGRKLSANTNGYINYQPDLYNWSAGNKSSCIIGIAHQFEEVHSDINLHANTTSTTMTLSQTRPIGPFRAKAQVVAGTNGVSIAFTGDKKIDKSTRFGLGVECSTQGVSFKIKISRLGHKLSIPILMSEQMDFKVAFFSMFVPIASYVALDKLIIQSWREKARQEHLQRIREENAEILAKRKEEAEAAQKLLAETVGRKTMEEKSDGLVIVSALYGKLPPSNLEQVRILSAQGIQDLAMSIKSQFSFLKDSELPVSHTIEFIDVTIPVQSLVANGQLHISGGHSKANLMGFYDPCYGEKKQLRIIYQFQGRLHEVTVSDTAPVSAPLRAHFVCV